MKNVRIEPIGKDRHYYIRNDRAYGKIVAGMCFPGRLPGYVCILGESFHPEHSIGPDIHRIDLLHEIEEMHGQVLLEKLADAVGTWEIDAVYGYLDEHQRHYLSSFNSYARGQNRMPIGLQHPPFAENDGIAVFIHILMDRLIPERKSFALFEGARLQSALMTLQAEEIPDARARDFPAIAAAGWAVSALTAYSRSHLKNLPTQANTEWDDGF